MSNDEEVRAPRINWIATGLVLGLPVGAALGAWIFDNLALGLLTGAAIGLTFGVTVTELDRRRRSK